VSQAAPAGELCRYAAGEMASSNTLLNWLFWLSVVAVAIVQFALCYEALVCRGHPPLTEMGVFKKWASTCLFWIPAVFGNRVMRFRGLAVIAIATTCLLVMISINGMLRPSIGHLAGVTGIIKAFYLEIVVATVFWSPFVFAMLYFPERVFGDVWRALWLQSTPNISFSEIWNAAWKINSRTAQRRRITSIWPL
jgi:hypothetical protein